MNKFTKFYFITCFELHIVAVKYIYNKIVFHPIFHELDFVFKDIEINKQINYALYLFLAN